MTGTKTMDLTTAGEREIVVTRVFNAPRASVFAAHIQPELAKQWLQGHDEWPLVECRLDAKPGGALRYVWRHLHDGKEMGLSGVFREVESPERIVHTELFDEDWTGGEALVTTRLDEEDGQTTLVMTVRYASRAVRDEVLKTGMEAGMAASYDRLAALLATRA